VIIEVEADQRPDGVSLRLIRARSIDTVIEGKSKLLSVEMDTPNALPAIKAQLRDPGEGEVMLVVSRESGRKRYEIRLKGGYRITPGLAQGIKSINGVVDVKLVGAA
jgi:DNA polymerase-3 subunit alpha